MNDLFLPTLAAGPRPVQPPDEFTPTGEFTRDLFFLMRNDTGQQRRDVYGHIALMAAAQFRADDMVQRGYFSHTDPDGFGPNYHVRRFGYKLPDWYHSAPDANNVESIATEAADPARCGRGSWAASRIGRICWGSWISTKRRCTWGSA